MNYVYIGKFEGTHGIKGEIKLKSNFEYINRVLKENFALYIGEEKIKETFKKFRIHKEKYLIILKDLEDINLIEKYINKKVYVLKEDLLLEQGQLVYEDYIGMNCYYNEKYLGKIIDIVNCGNNNYVIEVKDKKEILIPFNDNFIEKTNDKNIYFKNMEGFIDEN